MDYSHGILIGMTGSLVWRGPVRVDDIGKTTLDGQVEIIYPEYPVREEII